MTTRGKEPKDTKDTPREKWVTPYAALMGSVGLGATGVEEGEEQDPNEVLNVDEWGRKVRRGDYKRKKAKQQTDSGKRVEAPIAEAVEKGMLDPAVGEALQDIDHKDVREAMKVIDQSPLETIADLQLKGTDQEKYQILRYIRVSLSLASNYFAAENGSEALKAFLAQDFPKFQTYFEKMGKVVHLDPAQNSWVTAADPSDPDYVDVETLTLAEAAHRKAFEMPGLNGNTMDRIMAHESFRDCKTLKQLNDRFLEYGKNSVKNELIKMDMMGDATAGRIFDDVTQTYERLSRNPYLPIPDNSGDGERAARAIIHTKPAPRQR